MTHKRKRQQDYLFAQLRRQLWFHRETLAGRFPNMFTASAALGVSIKTIQRDIDAMKLEYGLPLQYDPKQFGFYYTEPARDPVVIFVQALMDPLWPPLPSRQGPFGNMIKRHIAPRQAPPMPEEDKSLKHLIGEYDPAKSAREFLRRYLNPAEPSLPSLPSVKTS